MRGGAEVRRCGGAELREVKDHFIAAVYTARMPCAGRFLLCLLPCVAHLFSTATVLAAGPPDWGRFRGPNGSGISTAHEVPTEFGPRQEPALAVGAAAGALVADPARRSHLPHRASATTRS